MRAEPLKINLDVFCRGEAIRLLSIYLERNCDALETYIFSVKFDASKSWPFPRPLRPKTVLAEYIVCRFFLLCPMSRKKSLANSPGQRRIQTERKTKTVPSFLWPLLTLLQFTPTRQNARAERLGVRERLLLCISAEGC